MQQLPDNTVEIDLYKDDFAALGDPELFAAVEAFTRVKLPATDRPQEGYLLDFKETWSISGLHAVAAFANTFGGILLVGVREQQGRADQLVGIETQRQELKTSIASSIATNIAPTPAYEIRDVAFPTDPGRRLCIVRVRKGNSLHLLTKKGDHPVYVRNEDESRPANAAELQALLATRFVSGQAGHADPIEYATSLRSGNNFYVTKVRDVSADGERVRSETFLQVTLRPTQPLMVRLDLSVERQFSGLVRSCYPEVAENVYRHGQSIGASFGEYRLRDWYHVTYHEHFRDYEMCWGIDSIGAVHFLTEARCKVMDEGAPTDVWSLCDLMTNLDWSIELAHQFWDYINYVGEASVLAHLHVGPLPLLSRSGGSQSAFASAFYERPGPRKRARPLPVDALSGSQRNGISTTAVVDLSYANRWGSHAEPVSVLVNQLLRDLGYATNLVDLRSCLP
jgi:hypothetical protein